MMEKYCVIANQGQEEKVPKDLKKFKIDFFSRKQHTKSRNKFRRKFHNENRMIFITPGVSCCSSQSFSTYSFHKKNRHSFPVSPAGGESSGISSAAFS